MASFLVRPLVYGDWPRIQAIWRELVPRINGEDLTAYLLRNPGLSLVAGTDRELVAVLLAGHDGWRATIRWLACSPLAEPAASDLMRALCGRVGREGLGEIVVAAHAATPDRDWGGLGFSLLPETANNRNWTLRLDPRLVASRGLHGGADCPASQWGQGLTSLDDA